jgi:excisionase family DNA binding protein
VYRRKNDKELFVLLPKGKDYYSVKEVAEILHVKVATVQNYITNNVIKAELVDGRRMVSRKALAQRLSELGKQAIYRYVFEEIPL